MSDLHNRFKTLGKVPLQVKGILLLIITAALLLLFNTTHSNQAIGATVAQVYFEGEYRIEEGAWQPIVEGEHIPSKKGDVTLRGNFHLLSPSGEYIGLFGGDVPIALYTNHINLRIKVDENTSYGVEHENPLIGASACGEVWNILSFMNNKTEQVEITIHNPHRFGNETAIDELLSKVAIYSGAGFERNVMSDSANQRSIGLLMIVISFVLLGTSLFSLLVHVGNSRISWLFGLSIFCGGIYFSYSAPDVSLWSESIIANTTILGLSMMFYMFFITCIISSILESTKKIGDITTISLGLMDGIFLILPMITKIYFYDTWLFWVIGQSLVSFIMIGCLIKECISGNQTKRWFYIGLLVLLCAFVIDAIASAYGIWNGGYVSGYAFIILFVMSLFVVLRIIPNSINATAKAKELELQRSRLEAEKNMIEAELKDSRISIMLSQIQPHFIYNTLGTIERMCLKDPEKAFDLVRNFSLYLRGNFSELDSVTPIQFSEEIKHVEYYVNIEKVRFPDMNIVYELETEDFVLPALSVQPLVENAIKHGLMRLETGGTVHIRSYETPTQYCVEVKDDGVGFDTTVSFDEKKHVGLRNIKGRLKAMVNGELLIESEIGNGTKAVIMIPKEVTVCEQ